MDDLDFLELGEEATGDVDAAAELERERAELLDWAAGALAARHPELRKERGTQYVAHGRRDLDAHLRRLHAAVKAGEAGQWQTYVEWSQVHDRGGHFDWDMDVLREALQRFLTPESAAECIRVLNRP